VQDVALSVIGVDILDLDEGGGRARAISFTAVHGRRYFLATP
jgi:hypothetical protein